MRICSVPSCDNKADVVESDRKGDVLGTAVNVAAL